MATHGLVTEQHHAVECRAVVRHGDVGLRADIHGIDGSGPCLPRTSPVRGSAYTAQGVDQPVSSVARPRVRSVIGSRVAGVRGSHITAKYSPAQACGRWSDYPQLGHLPAPTHIGGHISDGGESLMLGMIRSEGQETRLLEHLSTVGSRPSGSRNSRIARPQFAYESYHESAGLRDHRIVATSNNGRHTIREKQLHGCTIEQNIIWSSGHHNEISKG